MAYLISRLIDNCALKYQFPIRAPAIPTARPGKMKIGVNKTIAPRFTRQLMTRLMTNNKCEGTVPSIARMSCVHRAMIRPVGVSSNHLYAR